MRRALTIRAACGAPLFRWSFSRGLTNLHDHGGLHDSPSGLRRRRRLCAALSSPTTTELVPRSCLLEEFSSFLPARRALLWCGFVNNTTRGGQRAIKPGNSTYGWISPLLITPKRKPLRTLSACGTSVSHGASAPDLIKLRLHYR